MERHRLIIKLNTEKEKESDSRNLRVFSIYVLIDEVTIIKNIRSTLCVAH